MISRPYFIALAFALTNSVAHAAAPILPGDYVREGYRCGDAPFAALLRYDGSAFSGPHERDCTTRVMGRSGWRYQLETTCRAAGDGSPRPSLREVQTVVVFSPSRFSFSHETGNGQIDSAIYHRCPEGGEVDRSLSSGTRRH